MSELEPYENTLSEAELRRELRYYLDRFYGLVHALRDLPEFPPPFILTQISLAGKYPEDSNLGKQLQRKHGSAVIPYKTECEIGAGFWHRLRQGLMPADGETAGSEGEKA